MAREYARVKVSIWADPDFRRLTTGAQGLYFQLISSPTMNLAGVADWRPKRLAALSADSTAATIQANADELAAHGYVVIDDDTEEILVRSFVRHDRLIATPNIAAKMVKDYAGVASERLRGVIVHELCRLRGDDPDMSGWSVAGKLLTHPAIDPSVMPSRNPSVEASANPWVEASPNPSLNPSGNPSPMASPNPSGNGSHIHKPLTINQQPASMNLKAHTAPSDDEATAPPDGDAERRHDEDATNTAVGVDLLFGPKPETPATTTPAPDDQTDTPPATKRSTKRGTLVPDTFPVTDAMREWAIGQGYALDLERITAEFADYWRGVPGTKGVKLDWTATWRNRVRQVAERSPNGGRPIPKRPSGVPEAWYRETDPAAQQSRPRTTTPEWART